MRTVTWPDTHHEDAPVDHLYRSATWLLGRHPQLAELAARAHVTSVDEDGPDVDLDTLAEAFVERDALADAWTRYRKEHPEPEDDGAAQRWEAAGPGRGAPTTRALDVMSRTEVARLRLLATFSRFVRVPFKVSDLGGLDANGQRLLADWCRAVERA